MSERVRLLLFLVFCCLAARSQPGAYIRYTAEEGLSTRTIYDIYQDAEGFIWVSSNTGVFRFDGTHFRHFSIEDGVPDNEVLRLYGDRYGRVWFFGFNSKIGYYHKGCFHNPDSDTMLARIRFRNIPVFFYEGRNNTIHIKSQTYEYVQIKVGPERIDSVRTMDSSSSSYWENGHDTYLFREHTVYKNGQLITNCKPVSGVFNTAYPTAGAFYCQSEDGIYRFESDSFRLVYPRPPRQPRYSLRFTAQSKGRLFLLNDGGNILELQQGSNGTTPVKKYTNVPAPGEVIIDRKGDTWITSLTHGLYYYPRSRKNSRVAAYNAGWPGKTISEIRACGPFLIVGFENGSIAVFNKDLSLRKTLLQTPENLYFPIRKILFLPALQRLAAVNEVNLYTWRADTLGHITQPLHLGEIGLKGFVPDETGAIYYFSVFAICRARLAGNRFLSDSLFGNRVRKFAMCLSGNPEKIWYSDMQGLYVSDRGTIRAFKAHRRLLRKRIVDIRNPYPDRLLLVSDQDGVALTDTAGNLVHFLPPEKLHKGQVIKTDVIDGKLWIAGEAGIGIFRITRDSLIPFLWLDRNNGLLSNSIHAFCLDNEFLYVATSKGFQKLELATLPQQSDTPQLFIHSLSHAGQRWINPYRVDLPQGCKEIELECSALAFGNVSKVAFSYRFEGSDNFIGTSGPIFSIPINFEGNKRLFVRCRKGDSEWSKEQELLLSIPIPVYRQAGIVILFYILLLILAVVISFFIAGRIRRRQVRERDLKLQVASLEMRALQSMMNPHFVFNALNSIQHYINEHDADQGNKYLIKFSRLIRSSLNSSREAMIALGREIEYITNYLDLEQLRFGSKLHYTISVEDNVDPERILVPGMLIQPLVENAVIHAVMTSDTPVHIAINCTCDGERLFINIRDNGPGLEKPGPSPVTHKSLGLEMIRNRLQLLGEMQGKIYAFHLTDNSGTDRGTGATATLELPLIPVA